MGSPDWWYIFLKHAKSISKTETIPTKFTNRLNSSVKLFHLLIDNPSKLKALDQKALSALMANTIALHREIQQREMQTGHPARRSFYNVFGKSIGEGLDYARTFVTLGSKPAAASGSQKRMVTDSVIKTYKATTSGRSMLDLKRKYVEIMEAQHQASKKSGLKDTDADEADRLNSFLGVAIHWLKRLHALEYARDVLKENLGLEEYPLEKEPLPLQFRLEQDTSDLTFRLIRASQRKPIPEDLSVLDVINDCFSIPVFKKEGLQLVDDSEVIRFLRLHSEKNNLVNFKQDNLSQLAQQMYQIMLSTINDINSLFREVIQLINKTPMQDLEFAFADINPEECRALLRKKFQSLLPGINEKHYREETNNKKAEPSTRTKETMEDYHRDFLKLKENIFGTLKTTMATAYWLRRMIMSTLRNNFNLEKKANDKKLKLRKDGQIDFNKYVIVGLSVTIGEEDIANFYINPDDITSSKMSVQRADKADKWIAVRKSEKTHRILKKDFFAVIKNFIDKDLNPALSRYGFREISLNNQLLPEIHERLADDHRIDSIRSAILGTIITNLDEFKESKGFHHTLRRYFKQPEYDNIHYPEAEKMNQVARGIMHSKTSILQMKYRRVLKVKEEIKERLQQLKAVIKNEPLSSRQSADFKEEMKQTANLMGVIFKVQQIMVFAKPSLKDVKLEPNDEYVVVKPGEPD